MVRLISYSVLLSAIVAFGGLCVVLFGLSESQLQHRNQQREKDLATYLDRIEAYAQLNKTVPSFSSTFQQIGTAKEGCTLTNSSCDIQQSQCIDLNIVMNNRDLSVPSDVSKGTYYKTGYAVKFDSVEKIVTVIACDAEKGASISASRSLRTQLTPLVKHEKK